MEIFFALLIIYLNIKISNEDCTTYDNDYFCASSERDEWDSRCFQTPPKTASDYKDTYQDMHYLMGYAQLKYSSDRKTCTITFITKVNSASINNYDSNYKLLYTFGEIEKEENYIILNSETDKYPDGISISAKIVQKDNNETFAKLELEKEYLLWDNIEIIQNETIYQNGQKGSIVELFGWPYEDIYEECDFLKVAGYLGVKISPPNEYLLAGDWTDDNELNPWKYFYQTVSYKLNKTRLGTKHQLKKMINRCRNNGIRIYSQVVISQMTYNGNDAYANHCENNNYNFWGPKTSSGGSPFYTVKGRTENNTNTGLKPIFEYPSVPYCGSDIECLADTSNLIVLLEVNASKSSVQQRIADFFTVLISIGFSGISIYNAKGIMPDYYIEILKKFKENLGGGDLPEDFITNFELKFDNDKDILLCYNGTNFFGQAFTSKLVNNLFSEEDIKKIKFQAEGYPNQMPICNDNNDWIDKQRFVLTVEHPSNHVYDSSNINIVLKNPDTHKNNYISLFNNTIDSNIRIVFSSYSLTEKGTGFPDGLSDCSDIDGCYSVSYTKAYDPLSIGYDTGKENVNWKDGNYSRIHRNIDIVNAMREWLSLKRLTEEELYLYERYKAFGFPTTIPTTILTTIPTTIMTTLPTTIITTTLTTIPTTILTIIPTTIMTTILTTEINYSTDCEEKCLYCDKESKSLNLCIECNKAKNFYPINYNTNSQKYYDCILRDKNPIRFYFNIELQEFRPCYETCLKCNQEGNQSYHNCIECEADHMFRPDEPKNNCIAYCEFYYITPYGQYKCLDNLQCPEEAKYLIKEKNQCIDDCRKDSTYQYLYNGNCVDKCPENTEKDNDNYLCKEINIDKCKLSNDNIDISNDNVLEGIETLSKKYAVEFYYTNNHISNYKNNDYNIIIYKNKNCISELSLSMPKVDFGNCYERIKKASNINEDLIIAVVDKLGQNNPTTFYSFFHPITGEKLNAETICQNDTITVEENLLSFLNENDTNYDLMIFLTDQNINIFNISDLFYTDICYDFKNPLNKDIPLQDRIKTFYPNVTLCDEGCENKGVDIENMTALCDCTFNDIANSNFIKENVFIKDLVGDIFDVINESNILVFKCYKYIFKHFSKSIGGIITLCLLIINSILTAVFFIYEANKVKKYVYDLLENYLSFLHQSKGLNKNELNPPKKKSKFSNILDNSQNKDNLIKDNLIKDNLSENKNIKSNSIGIIDNSKKNNSEITDKILNTEENKTKKQKQQKKKIKKYKNSRFKTQNDLKKDQIKNSNKLFMGIKKKNNSKENLISSSFNTKSKIDNLKLNDNLIDQSLIINNNTPIVNQKNIDFFNEYLSTNPDDMDYDVAVYKDKRTFGEYFCENFIEDQIIATTFIHSEPLKTRCLKIMLFILNIILYFVVNGLFFSEKYISEVYNLEGEEGFFDFFPRSINRLFYTTIVSIIVSFIVDLFFFEEKKIKGIFKREKDEKLLIKEKIVELIKSMQKRYLLFIIIVFFILLLSFFYLLCFNYVYPKTQIEWVKSSITIMIIMQFLSVLKVLLETVLRFLSFRFKSERIYKISKLID